MRVLNADHWQRAGSFAGPSTGYESDMVATVAADLSIYADEDENSEVVAMAEKGESYDVVGKADDSWIKVAAGGWKAI